MPATTGQGYPYPLPTEPVAEGAQAIRNLAESLKGWQCIAELDMAVSSTFASIPQTFDSLRVLARLRGPGATATVNANTRVNNNSGAQYFNAFLAGSNNAATASTAGTAQTEAFSGLMSAASGTSGHHGALDMVIPGYTLATSVVALGTSHTIGTAGPTTISIYSFAWSYAAGGPVTRLDLFPTGGTLWAAGSRAWLYGISGF